MIGSFRWEVSSLTPLLIVERISPEEVRNIATFVLPHELLLHSPEGEEAAMYARLAAAAPELLDAVAEAEWGASVEVAGGLQEPGCPVCGAPQRNGHLGGCILASAFTKALDDRSTRAIPNLRGFNRSGSPDLLDLAGMPPEHRETMRRLARALNRSVSQEAA